MRWLHRSRRGSVELLLITTEAEKNGIKEFESVFVGYGNTYIFMCFLRAYQSTIFKVYSEHYYLKLLLLELNLKEYTYRVLSCIFAEVEKLVF